MKCNINTDEEKEDDIKRINVHLVHTKNDLAS